MKDAFHCCELWAQSSQPERQKMATALKQLWPDSLPDVIQLWAYLLHQIAELSS